jgi:succinate dehydrogenase hydrophobic anchor subunit
MLRYQLQRISAIGLVVFLFLHMIIMHYPPRELNYSNILDQMQTPLWKGIEISFLFFVIVHALAGAYGIVTDYDFLAKYKKVIAVLFLLAGLVAVYWGTTTVLSW